MHKIRRIGAALAILLTLVVVASWAIESSHYEVTDDAYVQADVVSVTTQTEGYVSKLFVKDNESVAAGQVLVQLDTRDAELDRDSSSADLTESKAAMKSALASIALERAKIEERTADIRAAEADSELAESKYRRIKELAAQGWVSQVDEQAAHADSDRRTANLMRARAELGTELKSIAAMRAKTSEVAAKIAKAQVDLRRGERRVERTWILSPAKGVVAANTVRVGQYLRPGTRLLSIVPVDDTYIVANLKETQVAEIRVGQPAKIEADAYGSRRIRGWVDSFSPGTGSQFALIPIDNANGNFTRLVQRLPIRIRIDKGDEIGRALLPGFSVTVRIDKRSNTGPLLTQLRTTAPQTTAVPSQRR